MSSDPPPSISTAHELEALHRISDRLTATDDDSVSSPSGLRIFLLKL
jgi:hypothetical protein